MTNEELELFPTSKNAQKMLSYVTEGFYDRSYIGKWIYQVMGIEMDEAEKLAEELPYQLFPETATWGLKYHEQKWGLPIRENLSYEERRRLIYQKRDYRAPMTPYRMEQFLSNATGFEVFIADKSDPGDFGWEAPHPNVFKAFFMGECTLDSKKAHELLNKLKQSHTTYTVNDRSEFELDNRDLEEFDLKRIIFPIGFRFWGGKVFDGTWLFDGSVMLNGDMRYGLRLGFKYRLGGFVTQGIVKLKEIILRAKLNIDNSTDTGVRNRFGIDFWQLHYLDGRWLLDGTYLLDSHRGSLNMALQLQAKVEEPSEEIEAEVVTKTPDCWFFDGALDFSGSRAFNSIYRKEVIE